MLFALDDVCSDVESVAEDDDPPATNAGGTSLSTEECRYTGE